MPEIYQNTDKLSKQIGFDCENRVKVTKVARNWIEPGLTKNAETSATCTRSFESNSLARVRMSK